MKKSLKGCPDNLLFQILQLFPKLGPELIKGDNGKLGVIGGNHQYTGAPYFCGMAAMNSVGKLTSRAQTFCTSSATRKASTL